MGESIKPSSFHNPTLSANKHVVQIYRSPLSAAVHCSGERRTSPFNGIERSLSRAVVIKTNSLPISSTTFATALSLYIARDGRKHKHNPTLSANKHVQICRSSLSAAADGLADGSGERRTSPVNGIERSLSRAVVPKTKSLPVSATTFQQRCLCTSSRVACERISDRYPSCSQEPLSFEKEININLEIENKGNKHQLPAWSMPTKCCWVIHRTAGWPANAKLPLPDRHSSITRPCCSSVQAPSSLSLHALEHSTGPEGVDA